MVKKVKIKTDLKNSPTVKVIVDNIDISEHITKCKVDLRGGYIPAVTVEFIPDIVDIEGEFYIEENKKVDDYEKNN